MRITPVNLDPYAFLDAGEETWPDSWLTADERKGAR